MIASWKPMCSADQTPSSPWRSAARTAGSVEAIGAKPVKTSEIRISSSYFGS